MLLLPGGLLSHAQDLPKIQKGKDYWLPAVREVPFKSDGFPFVMEPDLEARTGCYISIPFEHIDGQGATAVLKLRVEEWEEKPEIDQNNRYEVGTQTRHVSLVMQTTKTGTPSGFCVSSRKLPVGEVCTTKLTYSSRQDPPKSFYLTMHVPYWVKRVTLLSVEIKGYRFIEKSPAPTDEESRSIDEWIGQLAADQYALREKAHESLINIGERALPQLEESKGDRDPERRIRIREIIARIQRAQAERMPPVKMAR